MTTDIEPIDIPTSQSMPLGSMPLGSIPLEPTPFGRRLQFAREALNLESKDIASQLRLNEKIIIMMEKNQFTDEIPPTFRRGYLRAYAKLVNIPEAEVKKAIDEINRETSTLRPTYKSIGIPGHDTDNRGNYFMNIFTTLIIAALTGLIATWWYSHSTPPETPITPLVQPDKTMTAKATAAAPATPILKVENDEDNSDNDL